MFVTVFRILGISLICWLGTGCHRSALTVNSGVAPAASADTARDGLIVGTLVDSATNLPLSMAMVTVAMHGMDPGKRRVARSVTDSTGRYIFRVAYGRYDLHYVRIGFSNGERLGVRVAKGKPDSTVVLLPYSHIQLEQTVAPGGPTKPPSP